MKPSSDYTQFRLNSPNTAAHHQSRTTYRTNFAKLDTGSDLDRPLKGIGFVIQRREDTVEKICIGY